VRLGRVEWHGGFIDLESAGWNPEDPGAVAQAQLFENRSLVTLDRMGVAGIHSGHSQTWSVDVRVGPLALSVH